MHELWYDHAKLKYEEKSKLYYLNSENFIVQIKTEDIYSEIAKDVETKFYTSNYELDRAFPKGKIKKVTG